MPEIPDCTKVVLIIIIHSTRMHVILASACVWLGLTCVHGLASACVWLGLTCVHGLCGALTELKITFRKLVGK